MIKTFIFCEEEEEEYVGSTVRVSVDKAKDQVHLWFLLNNSFKITYMFYRKRHLVSYVIDGPNWAVEEVESRTG